MSRLPVAEVSRVAGSLESPHELPVARRSRAAEAALRLLLQSSTARGSSLALIDQAIVSGTNFLTMIVVARTTAVDQVGLYSLGFTLTMFFICIQGGLITSPYTVLGNRLAGHARRAYAGSSLIHQVAFAAAAMLSMVGLGFISGTGSLPEGFASVAWLLAGVVPFVLLREFVRRLALAHLEVGRVVVLDSLVAILQLGILWQLARIHRLSAASAFGAVGLACAAATFGVLRAMRYRFAPQLNGVAADLRRNWSLGKWGFAAQLTLLVSSSSLYWLIALRHGAELAGIFAACMSIPMLANPLIVGISNFIAPKCAQTFARRGPAQLCVLARQATLALAGGVGLIAILLSLIGGHVATWIYGAAFAGNDLGIGLQAFGMMALAICVPAGSGLWAIGQPRSNFLANMLGLVATLTSGLLFIGALGVTGAALAFLLGTGTTAMVKQLVFQRQCAQLVSRVRSSDGRPGARQPRVDSWKCWQE